MRRPGLLVTAIALILAGLMGIVLVALLSPAAGPGDGMDAMFIERMIPHHEDAVAMSELALERAQRPEIRRLAEDIRRSQSAEISQMRAWYRAWYGRDVPDVGGGMGMMDDMTDLDALASARDFDREFLEQMIPHHRMAVMMTGMARSAGGRPELRQLMDTMRRDQTREIRLMEQWYRDWYGG